MAPQVRKWGESEKEWKIPDIRFEAFFVFEFFYYFMAVLQLILVCENFLDRNCLRPMIYREKSCTTCPLPEGDTYSNHPS